MARQFIVKIHLFLRRLVRHPLLSATAAVLLAAVLFSFIFYLSEHDNGPPYDSFFGTMRSIPILIMSGYDVEPPKSLVALLCSYLLMLLGIVYVTIFTAIVATYFIETRLQRGISMGKIHFKDHILVCGNMQRARAILDQLFSPDLREVSPVALIHPSIEASPMDHPMLRVIKGDPVNAEILEQANARHAKAAIILADTEEMDSNAADAKNLLIALSIETFQPEIYSCVEVLNPRNVVHFDRVNVDEVVSVASIGNSLVVQSALNPGVSRFLEEILSFNEGDEIYRLPVPPKFVGKTFADLAATLAQCHEVVLIGVVADGRAVSNPTKRVFEKEDNIFVLAGDKPDLSGVGT